ncbi:hypothetical protein QE400_003626 [Xanthomonas sacchari]|uniref:hypothetical protein n=1 Tax=Xanthomonas sacchari TaxID=56458 RepID=UPI002781CB02|nr:hypothetical protein [Xanthomonas sacchari]MDQ1094213.1 hypothetical protein [Xanthomonas sacchari]
MFNGLFDKLFNRKPPSPDAFARLFLETLQARGYAEPLTYRPDEFRLVGQSGCTIHLHNAYRSYTQADRRRRDEALHSYVAAFLDDQEESRQQRSFEELRATLMPVIRNRGMFEDLRLEQQCEKGMDVPFPYACRDIAEDCVELLALDLPDSTSTLIGGPRPEWGISLDEGLSIARDNLRDVTEDRFAEVAPGVFRGAWHDAYDTSRALLPDVLHRAPVAGRPVFMLPTRDCLLVVGDRDTAAMAAMLELSLEAIEHGRCISWLVFTYDDARRIVPFALPAPALRQRQADLRRMLDTQAYAGQKVLLDKLHEANDVDVFVASFHVYQDRNDSTRQVSVGTWTDGVDTLLPRTDHIAFVVPRDDGEADVTIAEWEPAVALLGDMMELQPSLYPPRYRVRTFPSAERLRQLPPV